MASLRRGAAWCGWQRHGWERFGSERLIGAVAHSGSNPEAPTVHRLAEARHGWALFEVAGQVKVRNGNERFNAASRSYPGAMPGRRSQARWGAVRKGMAWPGEARLGMVAKGLNSTGDSEMTVEISEPYPIDFDALKKGDVISEQQIKDIFKPETETDYAFAILNLVGQIERERSDLYPVGRKGAIVILNDQEAHEHSVRRHAKLVGDMRRNARRRTRIDATEMTDASKRLVEHWDVQTAAQSMEAARRLKLSKREALLLTAPKKETG